MRFRVGAQDRDKPVCSVTHVGATSAAEGFMFFFGAARLWFGLAWLGSAWFGEPNRTEEKPNCRAKADGFVFSSVRLGFGLAWLGSLSLARQAAPKKNKKLLSQDGKALFFFGAARLGFGLAWFGRQTASKKKTAEPGQKGFCSSAWLGFGAAWLGSAWLCLAF